MRHVLGRAMRNAQGGWQRSLSVPRVQMVTQISAHVLMAIFQAATCASVHVVLDRHYDALTENCSEGKQQL